MKCVAAYSILLSSILICILIKRTNCITTDCRCWKNEVYREACDIGAFTNMDACLTAGCCYDDSTSLLLHTKPRIYCYKAKGTCPSNEECIIPGSRRRVCGHYALEMSLCEKRGCCYENSQYPFCYYSKRHTPTYFQTTSKVAVTQVPTLLSAFTPTSFQTNTASSTTFQSTSNTALPSVEGPQGFYAFGDLLVHFTCPRQFGISCGNYILNKETCIKHYCCWNDRNTATMYDRCFQPSMNITKLSQANSDAWGSWSSWNKCLGSACSSGVQRRNRTCQTSLNNIKRVCLGSSEETRKCSVACSPSWAPWLSWSSCLSSCGPDISMRMRKCLHKGKEVYANNCPGRSISSVDVTMCNEGLCHQWGRWEDTSCTSTCGRGVKVKFRICMGKEEMKPKENCFKEVIPCESTFCRFTPQKTWGPWSRWSGCSQGCGKRTRWRKRSCYVFLSKYVALPERLSSCIGGALRSQETSNCHNDLCYQWSSWAIVEPCRLTSCGQNHRLERRVCDEGTSDRYPGRCIERVTKCPLIPCK